jgi:hypothetical protein
MGPHRHSGNEVEPEKGHFGNELEPKKALNLKVAVIR